MSKETKNDEKKQNTSKDENIAKILNQVIAVLNNVKQQAQSLYEKKVPNSVKNSFKQAVHQASDGIKKVSNSCMNSKQACTAKVKNDSKVDN